MQVSDVAYGESCTLEMRPNAPRREKRVRKSEGSSFVDRRIALNASAAHVHRSVALASLAWELECHRY